MSDLSKIISRWNNINTFFVALFTQLCEIMIQILRDNTPGKTLPYEWVFDIKITGNTVTATIWNERVAQSPDFEQIMIYLDFGTVDHWIYPVNAQALSWEEDGIRYFSKGHRVSGIKASNFSAKATIAALKFKATVQRKFTTYMNTGRLPR